MINDINSNKTIFQLFEKFATNFSIFLNCIKIGEIISFDKNEQTCSVRVLHKQTNEYNPYERQLVEYPVLEKVPCVVIGGGTSYITHPISAGDQCVLLFSDYMIDGWWSSGEARPSDFPRRHDLSDAIAIVGLRALPQALQNYSDYLNLHYSDNSSIIIGDTVEVNNATTNINGDVNVTGIVTAPTLNATTAATGTFRSADNKTITVTNGIVTAIS